MEITLIIQYSIIAVLLLIALINRKRFWQYAQSHLFIWIIVIALMLGLYSYRHNLSDVKDTIIANIMPGQPIINQQIQQIVVNRAIDNHFYLVLDVNGTNIKFLVDTGASFIILKKSDIAVANLNPYLTSEYKAFRTANGDVLSQKLLIPYVKINDIEFENITAFSMDDANPLNTSLIGVDFLEHFKSYAFVGDQLIINY